MKRSLLIAAAAAATCGSAFAQSNVTVYGRLNVTVEQQKNIGADGTQTVEANNASRLGFKGTEDLGGGLAANFLIEHRFAPDTGVASTDFWSGDSWVGLSSTSLGSLRLGRMTSAAYYATADYVSMHNHDTGTSEDKLYTYLSNPRNTVAYLTPSFGGATLEAAVAAGEGVDDKSYNLAANYDAGPLHLGAGWEKKGGDKQFGVRALYELGDFTFGGYYQRSDLDALGTRNAFRLSGMYTMGASEFHLNVGFAGKWSEVDESKAKQYTVAYNYNLSKRTKIYAYYTKVDNGTGYSYFGATGANGEFLDASALALGIRHNF